MWLTELARLTADGTLGIEAEIRRVEGVFLVTASSGVNPKAVLPPTVLEWEERGVSPFFGSYLNTGGGGLRSVGGGYKAQPEWRRSHVQHG